MSRGDGLAGNDVGERLTHAELPQAGTRYRLCIICKVSQYEHTLFAVMQEIAEDPVIAEISDFSLGAGKSEILLTKLHELQQPVEQAPDY